MALNKDNDHFVREWPSIEVHWRTLEGYRSYLRIYLSNLQSTPPNSEEDLVTLVAEMHGMIAELIKNTKKKTQLFDCLQEARDMLTADVPLRKTEQNNFKTGLIRLFEKHLEVLTKSD